MYIRRKNESYDRRCVTTTVKFGNNSLMFCGGLSSYGIGPLVEIKGTINQNKYIELLNEHLLPYAKENLPPEWTFQQDNRPFHKTKKNQKLFSTKFCDCNGLASSVPHLKP